MHPTEESCFRPQNAKFMRHAEGVFFGRGEVPGAVSATVGLCLRWVSLPVGKRHIWEGACCLPCCRINWAVNAFASLVPSKFDRNFVLIVMSSFLGRRFVVLWPLCIHLVPSSLLIDEP